jgi:predicted amino acid racemase
VTAPRLEISLGKIFHNASTLVTRLQQRGIAVTGVTKACLGNPEVAATLLAAGVHTLGDSRIENIEVMRRAGMTGPIALVRTPMLSQVDRVVAHADISLNTELDVISALSDAAGSSGRRHAVLLMVELGDLREGIMPQDMETTVRRTLRFPHIDLRGIGANLACLSGTVPDARNMHELSRMADHLDQTFRGVASSITRVVSGGNSSNLQWALSGKAPGRINDLRLGEAILMGVCPLDSAPIEGLYTDAITLFAEVIEAKNKPSQPWGKLARSTFERTAKPRRRESASQMILAIGHQDVDPAGLVPPNDMQILGASSDHLVVTTNGPPAKPGHEIAFQLNYSALLRSMTSPYVSKDYQQQGSEARPKSQSQSIANSIPA